MPGSEELISSYFPRSSRYHPEWVKAGVSGGANPLWLTEWLTSAMDLRPGMRVLDLGCGRAMSSIFLYREFRVQVWAVDLWFSASENYQRICDAGVSDYVFPLHADARALPFAKDFFDAIVSIDSFFYYGTDDLYLNYLTRFLKPGSQIGIAGAGIMQEMDGDIPDLFRDWWEPEMYCLHSPDWWRRHWSRQQIVDVELADAMPDGWKRWLDWQKVICPENTVELKAVEKDQGKHLGYVRAVARLRHDAKRSEPITTVLTQYVKQPLLRSLD